MSGLPPVALHLALNHLPVLGLPFAAGLLAADLAFDNPEWRRAGLWTALLAAAAAWVVWLSGDPAADAAAAWPGVADLDVARHARAALGFAWAATAVAAAAAAALRRRRGAAAVLALALAASILGAWTAHLGGRIRHPELSGPR